MSFNFSQHIKWFKILLQLPKTLLTPLFMRNIRKLWHKIMVGLSTLSEHNLETVRSRRKIKTTFEMKKASSFRWFTVYLLPVNWNKSHETPIIDYRNVNVGILEKYRSNLWGHFLAKWGRFRYFYGKKVIEGKRLSFHLAKTASP